MSDGIKVLNSKDTEIVKVYHGFSRISGTSRVFSEILFKNNYLTDIADQGGANPRRAVLPQTLV